MNDFYCVAQEVLTLASDSIKKAARRLDNETVMKVVDQLDSLKQRGGNLIFCGVGKSGLLGESLSATFASLGLKSFFLHPIEALHGDLGRVGSEDCVVLLSKSGNTEEVLKLIGHLPVSEAQLIGLVGNINSPIAKKCGLVLDCSVSKEACLNDQAPTTSSTLTLAMGHMMAIVFQKMVGLSREGFASNHPGGMLGKSLKMKVKDLMVAREQCPTLNQDKTLYEAIFEMSKSPLGGLAIMDGEDFKGMIVEGDIRRTFVSEGEMAIKTPLKNIMNKNPISVAPHDSALMALKVMENRNRPLNIVPVIEKGSFVGFIRLHDLLKEGFTTSSVASQPSQSI
ncbi:MAG: KpsF/GutQ family sugar-phosphate isomerase [Bacteriovoracaceae bacterium]